MSNGLLGKLQGDIHICLTFAEYSMIVNQEGFIIIRFKTIYFFPVDRHHHVRKVTQAQVGEQWESVTDVRRR